MRPEPDLAIAEGWGFNLTDRSPFSGVWANELLENHGEDTQTSQHGGRKLLSALSRQSFDALPSRDFLIRLALSLSKDSDDNHTSFDRVSIE
jgi:hypothetical protein